MSQEADPVVTVVAEELADPSFIEEYDSSAVARASSSSTSGCLVLPWTLGLSSEVI
jgi:hypothetical protein